MVQIFINYNRVERGIVTSLITSFLFRLAYVGTSVGMGLWYIMEIWQEIISSFGKLNGDVWYMQCRNSRKDSTIQKCKTKLHGMKNYFQLYLVVGITGIFQNKEL